MAFLCEDELLHIFSYLPTKSICKFQSICKSFHDEFLGARFSMKHAQNTALKDDTCIFIQPDIPCLYSSGKHEFHPLPPPIGDEGSSFERLPRNSLKFLKEVRILASSNGLILCQSSRNNELRLCNPITQTWLPITTPADLLKSHFYANVFFKCINKDLNSDDYLIIFVEGAPNWGQHVILKLYSQNEGAWKNSEKDFFVGPMNIRFNMFVYLRKKLFLISNSSPSAFRDKDGHDLPPYMMAYDFVAGGESTIVNLPEDTLEDSLDWCCDLRIFEWGKEKSSDHSLCLVKYIRDSFTLWVFTEFKSSKWRKILEVGVKEMGVEEENPNVRGISVINGNCLIFATGRKVYGYYYLNDQSCWGLKEICEHNWDYISINLTPYSPTFRPCGTNESSIVSTRP